MLGEGSKEWLKVRLEKRAAFNSHVTETGLHAQGDGMLFQGFKQGHLLMLFRIPRGWL